jgi:hypothetical protein
MSITKSIAQWLISHYTLTEYFYMNHHCVNISRHIFHCNYNNPCTVRELHSAKSNAAEANTGSMLKPCQDGYQTQRERNVYSRTNRLHQQPEQKRLRHSATLVLLCKHTCPATN